MLIMKQKLLLAFRFCEYVKVIKPQSVINKILENVNKIKEYYSCN